MIAAMPERRPATEQISGVIELALARWVSKSLFLDGSHGGCWPRIRRKRRPRGHHSKRRKRLRHVIQVDSRFRGEVERSVAPPIRMLPSWKGVIPLVTSFSTGRGISTVPPKREGATRTVQYSKLGSKGLRPMCCCSFSRKVAIPLRGR
jgi:hypothetical protein